MTSLIKKLAKKVICAAPPSIELSGNYEFLFNLFSPIDKTVQDWALRQADFFSEEDWREIQFIKLKKILMHAGYNVPYWKKLFKKVDFNPEHFLDFDDLQKIPIHSRTDIKKVPIEELTAGNISRQRFINASTSGSTGEPLFFNQDARDNLRRYVNTLQELRYIGLNSRVPICVLGLETHHDLDGLGKRFSHNEMDNDELRRHTLYPYLTSKRVVLIANGSAVQKLAKFLKHDGIRLALRAIIYRAEQLSSETRRELSGIFRCPLFTTYGSRECSLLGIECEKNKLHLAPWMNKVEIIRTEGSTISENKAGDIIVTFFENYAMPFIRYRLGDRGFIEKEKCSCGRTSEIIRLYGRQSIFIRPPGYVSLPLLYFSRYLEEKFNKRILQYQFEEIVHSNTLKLRYVQLSVPGIDRTEIKSYFEELVGHRMNIEIELVKTIVPQAGGKIPIFIKT